MKTLKASPGVLVLLLCSIPAFPQSINVQARQPTNLLVCSWNIKWFRDTGRDLTKLAQVIAHFDSFGGVPSGGGG